MTDKFVEVTHQSWASRIGDSLKGVMTGILLIVVGIVLLFWNEGRAVKTYRALVESQGQVVSIDALEALPEMNGKLVHISGVATSDETLSDSALPVNVKALKLRRNVQTYQWEEKTHSEEKKQLGGSTETVTTYEYVKTWRSGYINSANFKHPEGHQNISPMYDSETHTANPISIGVYALSEAHTSDMNEFSPLPIAAGTAVDGLLRTGSEFYKGANPNNPQIGDQRISFEQVLPQEYSVVGDMSGTKLVPHRASNGHTIALVRAGKLSADDMFEAAKADNRMLTWILRGVGLVLLYAAFSMILRPLSVLADVVPLFGNLVAMGTGFVSLILAGIVGGLTIATAWIFYRPMVALAVLVVVAALIYSFRRRAKRAVANSAAVLQGAQASPL